MDITTLLNDLSTVVHGTTTNKVPNIYGLINRAARAVLLDVDPKETQRIVQLGQVFNDVYDYPIPVDLKGDRIIDLRPQAGRSPSDIFQQGYSQNFDANKIQSLSNKIITQWNTGVKTLRIQAPTLTSPVQLTDTSSITGWTAPGVTPAMFGLQGGNQLVLQGGNIFSLNSGQVSTNGVTNITLDTTNYVAGGGAIKFDLLANYSSGYLQTTSLFPIDLTSLVNTGTGFLWVYLPTGTAFTSVNVIWGSDLSNYYTYTCTATQQGTAFVNGWNLISFPWASSTQIGTPVNNMIDSVKVTFNFNGTLQTGVKICNLSFAPGFIYEIQYYSKYMFRNPSTNAFKEKVVDSTDNATLINLDTESYNLLFNKTAYYIAQTLQGSDASYDADYWQTEYNNALARYKAQNPSEAIDKAQAYYRLPKKNYSRFNPGFMTR